MFLKIGIQFRLPFNNSRISAAYDPLMPTKKAWFHSCDLSTRGASLYINFSFIIEAISMLDLLLFHDVLHCLLWSLKHENGCAIDLKTVFPV
jgi:predicted metal-dependent peptidase